jgi:hypothetical protein
LKRALQYCFEIFLTLYLPESPVFFPLTVRLDPENTNYFQGAQLKMHKLLHALHVKKVIAQW